MLLSVKVVKDITVVGSVKVADTMLVAIVVYGTETVVTSVTVIIDCVS